MNKAELVAAVAKAAKMSNRQARLTVDATLNTIRKNTKKGVNIAGFGSFTVTHRKARRGRNPRTGEEIKIGARRSVKFKAGKAYKGMV
ncbi:MAG: HU family DNA-binding protein [Candidatus Eisenbacteria sp.]|nr:HU family DNA-binding protein [Candidatus Eisenbacteria bacterium]